jgi:tryptophan synthase alpha subunit
MPTGPERIKHAIQTAQIEDRAALLVCLPSNQRTAWIVAAAKACVEAGADLIELQARAPRHPADVVDAAAVVAREVPAPILLWTDAAVARHFVLTEQPWRLVPACLDAGIAGVAAPIPADCARGFANACWGELAHVPFVSPAQTPYELAELCDHGASFAYAVGINTEPPTDAEVFEKFADFAERLRGIGGVPVFVGAAGGTPAQAALAATFAGGVAVAKAGFQALEHAHREGGDEIAALAALVAELRAGVERRSS